MRLAQRLDRIEVDYSKRWGEYVKGLTDEELVAEMLLTLQNDWHEIRRDHIEAMITYGEGALVDWQETVDRVLAERCEPIPGKKDCWRFKNREGSR